MKLHPMAATRLWAPLLLLLLAYQLKLKWSKFVQNYDLDICEDLQTTCIQTISKNNTELLRNESGYREFSRAKKSGVILRLGRLNGPSQLPMLLLLLGGDIEVNWT
jgi:endonuclease/exonuclease/phosphatase (EEP) superfamily protein YafD